MAARPEDQFLADENYPELNRAFYHSEPHEYFERRLSNALLVAGRYEKLNELVDDGVTYGELKVTRREKAPPRDPGKDASAAERFAALEAEVLLHHVAETLLRLFLAHRDLPPCPWLELARLRSFADFKKQISETFVDARYEDRRDAIGTVFYGVSDNSALDPQPTDAHWEKALTNIDGFLVFYADRFLSDAHLYNAAKHGLAVQPGEHMARLEVPNMPIAREGMALQYLQVKDNAWYRTVDWVDVEISLVYAMTATDLMNQLWEIARRRYVQEERVALQLFDGNPHEALRNARQPKDKNPVVLNSVSHQLLYYVTPPPQDQASDGLSDEE